MKKKNSYSQKRICHPSKVLQLQQITQIESGQDYCYAIDANHSVYAWGCNINQQLGLDSSNHSQYPSISEPQILESLEGKEIDRIASYADHSFAWSSKTGEVYGWGNRQFGKLGFGQEAENFILQPQLFQIFTEASQYGWTIQDIVCGNTHTLAIVNIKDDEEYEALNSEREKKLPNSEGNKATAIANKNQNSLEDAKNHCGNIGKKGINQYQNQLFVWGQSKNWQLGLGMDEQEDFNHPHQLEVSNAISEDDSVYKVAASNGFSMAISTKGKLFSWGSGEFGRLGLLNETKIQKIPCQINFSNENCKIKKVSLGAYHSLALTEDGLVYSFGRGTNGQLGNGSNSNEDTPVLIESLRDIIDLASGESHSLALNFKGEVFAWGSSNQGQLGLGDFLRKNIPEKLKDLNDVQIVSIKSGKKHSLALTQDGSVYAWGSNDFGQIGQGPLYSNSGQIFNKQNSSSSLPVLQSHSHSMGPSYNNNNTTNNSNNNQNQQGQIQPYPFHSQASSQDYYRQPIFQHFPSNIEARDNPSQDNHPLQSQFHQQQQLYQPFIRQTSLSQNTTQSKDFSQMQQQQSKNGNKQQRYSDYIPQSEESYQQINFSHFNLNQGFDCNNQNNNFRNKSPFSINNNGNGQNIQNKMNSKNNHNNNININSRNNLSSFSTPLPDSFKTPDTQDSKDFLINNFSYSNNQHQFQQQQYYQQLQSQFQQHQIQNQFNQNTQQQQHKQQNSYLYNYPQQFQNISPEELGKQTDYFQQQQQFTSQDNIVEDFQPLSGSQEEQPQQNSKKDLSNSNNGQNNGKANNLQEIIKENEMLKTRIRHLESNQDLDQYQESQEKIFDIINNWYKKVDQVLLLRQQQSNHNSNEKNSMNNNSDNEQLLFYKNSEIDKISKESKNTIDGVKGCNMQAAYFCTNLIDKFTRSIKRQLNS